MESKDGGPAFPREDYQTDNAGGQSGMSLRDWFAGQALAGRNLMASSTHSTPEDGARRAYEYADAMLAARGGQQ